MIDSTNGIQKKKDHPIKTILMAIGLGIVIVIVANLASFGLILQLASYLAGCGYISEPCTKVQLIHMGIIDVLISISGFLFVMWLDTHDKPSPNEVKHE